MFWWTCGITLFLLSFVSLGQWNVFPSVFFLIFALGVFFNIERRAKVTDNLNGGNVIKKAYLNRPMYCINKLLIDKHFCYKSISISFNPHFFLHRTLPTPCFFRVHVRLGMSIPFSWIGADKYYGVTVYLQTKERMLRWKNTLEYRKKPSATKNSLTRQKMWRVFFSYVCHYGKPF